MNNWSARAFLRFGGLVLGEMCIKEGFDFLRVDKENEFVVIGCWKLLFLMLLRDDMST